MDDQQQSDTTTPPSPEQKPQSATTRFGDMGVRVSVVLGGAMQTLDELLDIGEQSLIELDRMVGDPVDIFLNGKLFARGEVVTVSDNFGVRVTELLDKERVR